MSRKSTNYVCTLDINSYSDMEKLSVIKATVSAINKNISTHNKKRIVIRGRKPFQRKNICGNLVSYDYGGNIVGGIANASKLDVYIYDRRDHY